MRATVGDHVLVRGRKVGAADRDGEILEVKGSAGEPPYLVRWTDGTSGIFFPSCDADVVPKQPD